MDVCVLCPNPHRRGGAVFEAREPPNVVAARDGQVAEGGVVLPERVWVWAMGVTGGRRLREGCPEPGA